MRNARCFIQMYIFDLPLRKGAVGVTIRVGTPGTQDPIRATPKLWNAQANVLKILFC